MKVKKAQHIIEIMDFKGVNLYESEITEQYPELRAYIQMKETLNIYVEIWNEKTSVRDLSVIKMNMNTKEHKTYPLKT